MALAARFGSPPQLFALVSAVVYLGIGIVGFFITGFDDFAVETDEKLIIFGINPLHNIVHLVLGLGWLAAAPGRFSSTVVNFFYGIVLLAVALLGFLGLLEFLSIHGATEPDNYLHLVWGALALVFGYLGL